MVMVSAAAVEERGDLVLGSHYMFVEKRPLLPCTPTV